MHVPYDVHRVAQAPDLPLEPWPGWHPIAQPGRYGNPDAKAESHLDAQPVEDIAGSLPEGHGTLLICQRCVVPSFGIDHTVPHRHQRQLNIAVHVELVEDTIAIAVHRFR